jgi:hypothetical protein
MNPLVRLVLGVILGFVGGSAAMMACHYATMPLYPPPDGLDVMDPGQREAVQEWMKTLPDGAFVVAALCHWLGTAVGAAIAMFVAGRHSIRPALVIGVLFTVAGIMNVMQVPHPTWFPFVDAPGYLIVAWLVGKALVRPADASA